MPGAQPATRSSSRSRLATSTWSVRVHDSVSSCRGKPWAARAGGPRDTSRRVEPRDPPARGRAAGSRRRGRGRDRAPVGGAEAVVEHDDRRTAIHVGGCADDAVGFLDVIHAGGGDERARWPRRWSAVTPPYPRRAARPVTAGAKGLDEEHGRRGLARAPAVRLPSGHGDIGLERADEATERRLAALLAHLSRGRERGRMTFDVGFHVVRTG